MMLLRFRLQNHKSFRDVAEISLVSSRLKTARPIEGAWGDYVYRVAGLYGANASGKSSVLEALEFMMEVIKNSATVWRGRKRLPHHPFALDESSRSSPSHYSVDFLLDDIRYEYGFSLSRSGIQSEWLYDYPVGRQRLLYERGLGDDEFRFGRALKGSNAPLERLTNRNELVLSRAANDRHEVLTRIFERLTGGFDFAQFSEGDRQQRLRDIAEGLATEAIQVADIITLLQVADVGIAEVEVSEVKTPPFLLKWAEAVQKVSDEARPATGSSEQLVNDEENVKIVIEEVTKHLAFHHLGEDGRSYMLKPEDQSTGTLSWLSLAVPAVETLRKGTVLLIDEIDASLHPQLAQVLIRMFKDESLNPHGAQMIFTTHDTYFLSPSADTRLDPEEVWFVEKNRAGVSDIYSLGDFGTRRDQNLSRRYLHGRYGATPSVAPAFLAHLVAADSRGSDE